MEKREGRFDPSEISEDLIEPAKRLIVVSMKRFKGAKGFQVGLKHERIVVLQDGNKYYKLIDEWVKRDDDKISWVSAGPLNTGLNIFGYEKNEDGSFSPLPHLELPRSRHFADESTLESLRGFSGEEIERLTISIQNAERIDITGFPNTKRALVKFNRRT